MSCFTLQVLNKLFSCRQWTRLSNQLKALQYSTNVRGEGHYFEECGESIVKVAVIGDPNAGKSSLVNSILGRRVTSVSRKVHTTRRKTLAVLNVESTQIIFVDAPGFVSKKSRAKHDLESSLFYDPYTSVKDVDIVIAVHDSHNYYTKHKLSAEVCTALRTVSSQTKCILALNKVDLIKNKFELLSTTKTLINPKTSSRRNRKSYRQLFDDYSDSLTQNKSKRVDEVEIKEIPTHLPKEFDQVFMVSALDGTGVNALKEYIVNNARPGSWKYEQGFYTDQSLEEMIVLCVKEKMLNLLSEEIPYLIIPKVDLIHEDGSGCLNIVVSLPCSSTRLASQLMGPTGNTIRAVAVSAEQSLSEALLKPVILRLNLKTPKKSNKP